MNITETHSFSQQKSKDNFKKIISTINVKKNNSGKIKGFFKFRHVKKPFKLKYTVKNMPKRLKDAQQIEERSRIIIKAVALNELQCIFIPIEGIRKSNFVKALVYVLRKSKKQMFTCSYRELSHHLNLSVRQAKTIMNYLHMSGYLKIVEEIHMYPDYIPNTYVLSSIFSNQNVIVRLLDIHSENQSQLTHSKIEAVNKYYEKRESLGFETPMVKPRNYPFDSSNYEFRLHFTRIRINENNIKNFNNKKNSVYVLELEKKEILQKMKVLYSEKFLLSEEEFKTKMGGLQKQARLVLNNISVEKAKEELSSSISHESKIQTRIPIPTREKTLAEIMAESKSGFVVN